MERKDFDREIKRFHTLLGKCHKKAVEVLMKLQGETDFRLTDSYTFIARGNGRFESAYLKGDQAYFTIRLDDRTTRDIDFFEATWDSVMLCDVMDKFFDLDSDGTHYDDDDDDDENFYGALHS